MSISLLRRLPSITYRCMLLRISQNYFPANLRSLSGRPTVTIHFEGSKNYKKTVTASVGETFHDVIKENGIDQIECACEGTMECTTCHIILNKEVYKTLPQPAESEMDMLDLAADYCEGQSRLGCQVRVQSSLEGTTITIPENTTNHMVT